MRKNRARERRALGILNIPYAGTQKMMFAFLTLACAALIFVQPIKKKEEAKKEEVRSAGDMMIEIRWPGCKKYEVNEKGFQVCKERIDIDIDLWGKSPDDERPVGYSNRAGRTLNLLRDDLGTVNDTTDENKEIMYARGLPEGEYVFNLHYFADREPGEGTHEVPVDVVISTKAGGDDKETGGMKAIITRKAVLRIKGEEITVARFTLDANHELVKDSVNDFFEELRTWQPQPTQ